MLQPTGDRELRLHEFAALSGYAVNTVRKKVLTRQFGYTKIGRLVLIPQSELERIRGEYRRPDRWGVRRWQPPLSLLQNHTIKLRSSGGLETVRLRVPFHYHDYLLRRV